MIDPSRRLVCLGLLATAAPLRALATPAPEPIAARLGTIIAGARADALSTEVRERIMLSIADTLATLSFTTVEARHDPFLARTRDNGGRPEAKVPGMNFAVPLEDAAAATAYLIHYAETDESDFRASLRASPTVMGPVLALMQRPGVTGADAIAAIALGFSVLGGLAEPFGPTQDDGLMSAGVWGPSASAAVAARLLRLDAVKAGNAMALAAGAAQGTFQYYYDQTEEKRLIVARAARMGVEAALMAAAGMEGPAHAYEGRAGLYPLLTRITHETPDYGHVVDAVRRLDGPLYLYPKFFSASASITPSLEGLAPLVASGLNAKDVAGIVVRGDPAPDKLFGVVGPKLQHFEPPGTEIGAKINYAYMVAFLLVHGHADAATVARARLDDPAVLDLARRVTFQPVPGDEGHLIVKLRSGEAREVTVPNQRDHAIAPPALALRDQKIRDLTAPAWGTRGYAIVERLAAALPSAPSGAGWVDQVDRQLLDPPGRTPRPS